MKPRRYSVISRILVLAGVAVLLTLIFFRIQFLNGFSVLFGDRFDGVIEISILEHWYNVFRGLEPWSETLYFYPHTGTLGYNDGYFLYGLVYVLLRTCWIDPFLASELVNIVIKNIGFFAFFVMMRRVASVEFGWALFAAILFTLGNSTFVHVGHAQLLSIAFVPLMICLLCEGKQAFREDDQIRLILWGSGAGIFYAAWVMTGYYMAWFFSYFLFIFILVLAWLERKKFPAFQQAAKKQALALSIVVFATGLALTPFLKVYLPKSSETVIEHTASWTPAILDIINVGDQNLLFGDAVQMLNAWLRPDYATHNHYELSTGLPLILLVLFGMAAYSLGREKKTQSSPVVLALVWAVLISWLLTLHIIGFTHQRWSLWKFAHMLLPGASGIRTASRYQIFLTVPIIAITIAWLASRARRLSETGLAVIIFLLVLEQINLAQPANLGRVDEMKRLSALPTPPETCHTFYVSVAREGPTPPAGTNLLYSPNVDAMLIAEIKRLPTINGVSSYNPPDWDFADVTATDYSAHVQSYAAAHHVQGLCALDLQNLRWN